MKNCKNCQIELTEETAAKAYSKSGKFRAICRKCRSKQTMQYRKDNLEATRIRTNEWARRIGKVKQYPCETCNKLCYKKYAKAFCSDKCRFMSHVDATGDCWFWKSAFGKGGYGKTSKNSQIISAHRLSYELFIGPIEDGKFVCHTCDISKCVKPAHLWLGTAHENKLDQIEKDRVGKKLNEFDVFQIRKLYNQGIKPQQLAYMYNVLCSTITNIVKRRIWKHI